MENTLKRKLKMGMVGGGKGSFIGAVHRIAAQLDNHIELVAGAFNRDEQQSIASGLALYLSPDRCYGSYQEMFDIEANKPAAEKLDFIAIVTPNHLHFPVAKLALEKGFHVISDKPATLNLAEALALQKVIKTSGRLYALTHTYTGYPMIKEAKHLIANNKLGKITKVVAEYSQGWLAGTENDDNKQAAWRLDPTQSGASCCMGDIGVHAAHLAEYVSGLEISELCADLAPVVNGRSLDDDGSIFIRFNNKAKGLLFASQISVGEENNLRLRIYGELGSIDWSQQEPNSLWLKSSNAPTQLIRTGVGQQHTTTLNAIRTPAGHPEGYLEAFANIYINFAKQIINFEHDPNSNHDFDVPNINDAIRGMAFIENAVQSHQTEYKWHKFHIPSINTH